MKNLRFLGKLSAVTILVSLFNQTAMAVTLPEPVTNVIRNQFPASAEPGVVSNQIAAQQAPKEQKAVRTALPQEKQEAESALGPQAAQIKFKLNKIYLEGNHTYTEKQLKPIYADKLGKTISIADLEKIVQNITNYYRNNGYILSRAILPPQHVANGEVHIRVIEGYISEVRVQGNPKRARCIVQAYGNKITESRPTDIKVMERYLRIENEIPGMNARAVLEPSKSNTGASDMNIVANEKTVQGYISYDNYGTRYIGPNQVTGSISVNSLYQSGDSTHLTMVRTSRPLQLQYVDLSHDFPMGTSGLRGALDANNSRTMPGMNLALLKIDGDASNFNATATYPLIRSRDQDLTLDGGGYYIDSGVNTFDQTLYNDHLRTLRAGGSYNFADKYYGANLLALHAEQGLEVLGASDDPTSPTVSRFGADGHFTKFYASASRLQQIYGRFSAYFYATGQYSFNPLLSSEQFAYGGSQLGRGYDPAEIIGDEGAAGSVEIRANFAPTVYGIQMSAQPYIFYDAGVIWNLKNVPGVNMKQSCTSVGFGMRFTFTQYLSGNLMFAQPLTKQVSAEELVGEGRLPRGFFSFVASA